LVEIDNSEVDENISPGGVALFVENDSRIRPELRRSILFVESDQPIIAPEERSVCRKRYTHLTGAPEERPVKIGSNRLTGAFGTTNRSLLRSSPEISRIHSTNRTLLRSFNFD
jgi:hypothetical protein